jgi:rod shape determining protein RodA
MAAKLLSRAVGRVFMRRMPWALLLGALVLSGVGAAFIRSSHSAALAQKHVIFAGAGCVAFFTLALFDYRHLTGLALPLYAVGVGALTALFVLGIRLNYARRWFDLGFFHVQPSEPMKYVMVIVLAEVFRLREEAQRLRDLVPPLVLTGVPVLLIVLQPDLGTALIFVPLLFVMAFLGGVPLRKLVMLGLAGLVLVAGAWFTPGVLKDYQRERILTLVDPASNPESDAAYNAEQATMAISAGGWKGQGWGQGVLTRLGRIPEQYADFIFPVIAEEWGFVRTAPLIGVYVLMTALMAHLAAVTREPFGRLLIGGVLTLFAVQAFLHVAVSLRLAPITGLTLPLVSYGGSSLVSTYAGFGLVASVRLRRSVVFKDEEPGQ